MQSITEEQLTKFTEALQFVINDVVNAICADCNDMDEVCSYQPSVEDTDIMSCLSALDISYIEKLVPQHLELADYFFN